MYKGRSRIALVASVLALVVGLAACGGGGKQPAAGNTPGNVVNITGFLFKPAALTVAAGTTVEWLNGDDIAHTVTAGTPEAPTGMFASGDRTKGQTFTHAFSDPGTYVYFCSNHNGMRGEVKVTA
jgi:plastocyanin